MPNGASMQDGRLSKNQTKSADSSMDQESADDITPIFVDRNLHLTFTVSELMTQNVLSKVFVFDLSKLCLPEVPEVPDGPATLDAVHSALVHEVKTKAASPLEYSTVDKHLQIVGYKDVQVLEDNDLQIEDNDGQLEDNGVQLEDKDVQIDNNDVQIDDNDVQIDDNDGQLEDNGVQIDDNGIHIEDNDLQKDDNGIHIVQENYKQMVQENCKQMAEDNQKQMVEENGIQVVEDNDNSLSENEIELDYVPSSEGEDNKLSSGDDHEYAPEEEEEESE
ncbi:hypothetical protein METBIDRAFT_9389 [Metschnikowia bicuspidata var. bicuspidata NRRL YB-4993]|uniref:Uncharacterized protein n=1 Tax=Metschnikowia bicuspidata var. bicuspidata NRRL YB-4993 TaxID=869754 RepID=A0A1A0HFY8_9ASCO|nr:hypothetical protein METBIDRAFT_9389 [Metschnikowia bicuspidata var. bicuspidata NRRL YB-4993]OBA23074.1 hypothetical protein METBIDRAFT_9389 [Metschnikowia bicuspidata var. bicuspidata NRRL YB-4993]